MKHAASFALAWAILAGTVMLGGCVSKQELDELRVINRNAREELAKCRQSLRGAEENNQKLADRARDMQATLTFKDELIAKYDRDGKLLKDRLAELKKRLDNLTGPTPTPLPPFRPLPQPVDKALKEFAAANPQLVEYVSRYGMVKFKSDEALTFDKGKVDVRPAAREALAKFVEIINTDAASKFHVYVAGHTDDIPIKLPATRGRHPTNWYLSVHRAVAVQKVLQAAGLAPGRIGVMGFGEFHPVAPNAAGKRGNKLNRRVEIWIVPPGRFLTLGDLGAVSETPEK